MIRMTCRRSWKKILEADAIIHSVPLYFWAMTAQMKAYLDRWCALFDPLGMAHTLCPQDEGKEDRTDHGVWGSESFHIGSHRPQLQEYM